MVRPTAKQQASVTARLVLLCVGLLGVGLIAASLRASSSPSFNPYLSLSFSSNWSLLSSDAPPFASHHHSNPNPIVNLTLSYSFIFPFLRSLGELPLHQFCLLTPLVVLQGHGDNNVKDCRVLSATFFWFAFSTTRYSTINHVSYLLTATLSTFSYVLCFTFSFSFFFFTFFTSWGLHFRLLLWWFWSMYICVK